ncbi:peptide-methionine (S)-S-oxide reductase [Nakamurella antarctica]|uniref:Peptide methionine sulfoxide reductase MsrA n=1 Tax=Nakamurella antarctica TaxID=1902245 RepID=A0A3G8ZZT4_9ACTN|nr:peptide-methionine (S)-S-oxide reductase [Nakamurella antarctica]
MDTPAGTAQDDTPDQAVAALPIESRTAAIPTVDTSAIPAPTASFTTGTTSSEPQPLARTETALLAGGCFWGVQGVFEHVNGVIRAESGYSGGTAETANYAAVSSGTTGHAEAVKITFDPTELTFAQVLHIFFSVVHDPTQHNQQGPDVGTQYRSAIFSQDAAQQQAAQIYIAELTADNVFSGPIATTLEPNTGFFPAEEYHQDFFNSHTDFPYIVANDVSKVEELKALFPQLYRESAVLVSVN